MNNKSVAWDFIGGEFWEYGRPTARPSKNEIELFVKGIHHNDCCCVIGASTKDLIENILVISNNVFVYDFSRRMCNDLQKSISSKKLSIQELDICAELPKEKYESMDFIVNDRLINRFDLKEIVNYLRSCYEMLRPGGLLKSSLKLGLYEMDKKLITADKNRLKSLTVFDEENNTIDYSNTLDILEDCIIPHGSISKDKLIQWYSNRGKEKRFMNGDFEELFNTEFSNINFHIEEKIDFIDTPNTILFSMRKT